MTLRLVVLLLVACAEAALSAQQNRLGAPAPAGTEELAKGWSALAAGRVADAEAVADSMLQAGTRRHDAASLKVHGRVQAGRPEAALDAYEQWLAAAVAEDVFLIQPVAHGLLQLLARSQDPVVRVQALTALADAGDRDAAARLSELAETEGAGADIPLARMGNPQAIRRLQQIVSSAGPRADVSAAIGGLAKAKATGASSVIAAALDPSRPLPTRLSAARALAELDAKDAVPRLQQALKDPDVPMRIVAAASLARLGDQSGADLLREMENSPVADIRLMVAEITAPQNPNGAWVGTAIAALRDADPLARLSAAELLIQHAADPRPGVAAITLALTDLNPAMREAASRSLGEVPATALAGDIAGLRRLLRDPGLSVRVAAASALLRVAGGIQ